MRKISTGALGMVLFFTPFFVFAQEAAPVNNVLGSYEGTSAGNAACFDFYTFGSVEVELLPVLPQTVSGSNFAFSGKIKNNNPYPLTDGTLYVKIYKRNQTFSASAGDQLVDQFVVNERFTFAGNSEKQLTFNWKVPANLPAGNYSAAFFFLTGDRFNILGLPFTDDVTGQKATFTVVNNEEQPVAFFDREKATLNGQPYAFIGMPPAFGPGEPVEVKISITNPSSEAKQIPISWKEYRWDSLPADNFRAKKEERVNLAPNETKELLYRIEPKNDSVAYLTVEAKDQETKSIANFRFVRNEVLDTRLNFAGLLSYPLKANQENALLACAHAAGYKDVPNTVLTLTLKDSSGKVIYEYEYAGGQTGQMGGFKGIFTPKNDYKNVTLTATLKQDGKVKEEVTLTYNCEDINLQVCQQITEPARGGVFQNELLQKILIGGAGIVVFLVALLFFRRAGRKRVQFVWMLGFLLGTSLFFGMSPHTAEAAKNARIQGTQQINMSFNNGVSANGPVDYTVDYYADAVNADTNESITDGSTLYPGARIKFVPKPRTDRADVFWFFRGQVFGTPQGWWGNPTDFCVPGDHIGGGQDTQGANVAVFLTYSVTPTNTETSVGGTAGLQEVGTDGAGNTIYQIVSGGNIHADIRFLPTDSNFISYLRRQNNYSVCGTGAVEPLSLPERTLSFDFTVPGGSTGNRPPNPPTISGPTAGSPNIAYTFTATANDPDGDQIRYYFDWNRDGVADECSPSDCSLVPSGTGRSADRSWTTEGQKSFQVRVRDAYNQYSGWTVHSIGLTNYSNQSGYCGPATSTPYSTAPPADQLCVAPSTVFGGGATLTPDGNSWSWTCNVPATSGTCPSWRSSDDCAALGYSYQTSVNTADEGYPSQFATNGYCWEQYGNNIDIYFKNCTAGSPAFGVYCLGPYQSGPPSSLKLCEGSCSSGIEVPGSFTMSRNSTKDVVACWNTASACTDGSGNVSATANWSEGGGSAISLSGTDPKRVNADNSGTESFSASYSGQTANRNVTVACVPTVTCDNAPGRENYCENQTFTVDNGCGNNISCNGTKTCNYNWKEVAP